MFSFDGMLLSYEKDEIMAIETKCMKMEVITLSKISHKLKDNYWMESHL